MKRTAAVCLVLLASVVTGGEQVRLSAPVAQPVVAVQKQAPEPSLLAEEFAGLKQVRMHREGARVDLFDSEGQTVIAAARGVAPTPVHPAKPEALASVAVAPPLPFKYLGRMQGPERSFVYLLRNQEMLIALAGETLDKDYRVEQISDSAVHLTYLPLSTPQILTIPPAP